MRVKIIDKGIGIIRYATIILLSLSILFVFLNLELYYHGGLSFNIIMVAMFIGLIGGIIYGTYYLVKKYHAKNGFNIVLKLSLIFISIGVIVFQIFYIYENYMPSGWDVAVVMGHAVKTNIIDEYFLRYYNNMLLCAILKGFFRLFGDIFNHNHWLMATIMNGLALDFAVFAICFISYRHIGKSAFFITYILSLLSIALSLYITIPYSDTIGMVFLTAVLVVGFEGLNSKRSRFLPFIIILLITFGIMAYMIKPTTIFISALLFIAVIIKSIKMNKGLKLKLTVIILIIIGTMLGTFAGNYIVKTSEYIVLTKEYSDDVKYSLAFPMTHFIMMGTQQHEKEHGYVFGAYSTKDTSDTIKIPGKKEKTQFNIEETIKRLKQMGIRSIAFYFNKYIWFSTDGTFNYNDGAREAHECKNQGFLHQLSCRQSDFYRNIYINYFQGLWVVILMLCVISNIFRENYKDKKYVIINIAILMLIGFLLVFEAQPRYLLIYLPLYILMASYGFIGVKKRYLQNDLKT